MSAAKELVRKYGPLTIETHPNQFLSTLFLYKLNTQLKGKQAMKVNFDTLRAVFRIFMEDQHGFHDCDSQARNRIKTAVCCISFAYRCMHSSHTKNIYSGSQSRLADTYSTWALSLPF